jgi:hypothetical protein
VLRAAEAAAAAAQAAAAAAQAASLPPIAEEPPAAVPTEPPAPSEPPADASSEPAVDVPAAHTAGAPERLLAAADDLGALVAQAREQLDALEDALARLEGPVEPAQ